jgi:dynein heavy chain, axonemal
MDTQRALIGKLLMQVLKEKLDTQLKELTAMVRQDLDPNTRRKVNTLMILDVHARDIVGELSELKTASTSDFKWESQLRFYWNTDEEDVLIKQCTGVSKFRWEHPLFG